MRVLLLLVVLYGTLLWSIGGDCGHQGIMIKRRNVGAILHTAGRFLLHVELITARLARHEKPNALPNVTRPMVINGGDQCANKASLGLLTGKASFGLGISKGRLGLDFC